MTLLTAIFAMIKSDKWLVVCLNGGKHIDLHLKGNITSNEYEGIGTGLMLIADVQNAEDSAVREVNEILGNDF